MRKIISIVLVILIIGCMSLSVSANDTDSYSYYFNDFEVIISGDVNENEAYIIASILYCDEMGIDRPIPCAPCDISGHYYTYSYATSTTHKVYNVTPRCVLKNYKVTLCTKCSTSFKTLLSQERVDCCA